ncbi:MAG: hypothetical protein ABF811_07765 [Pseudoclavibacter sp.]|jgi:hypothetical protein
MKIPALVVVLDTIAGVGIMLGAGVLGWMWVSWYLEFRGKPRPIQSRLLWAFTIIGWVIGGVVLLGSCFTLAIVIGFGLYQ